MATYKLTEKQGKKVDRLISATKTEPVSGSVCIDIPEGILGMVKVTNRFNEVLGFITVKEAFKL